MPVTVTHSGGPLPRPKVSDAALKEIGEWIVQTIRKRTTAGRDVEGAPFAPYSPGYAEAKGTALLLGRLPKAFGRARTKAGALKGSRVSWAGPVNLTLSGAMLNAMTPTIRRDAQNSLVSVGFTGFAGRPARGGTMIQRSRQTGAADKAYWHNESGAGRAGVRRRFFDLSEREMDAIQAFVTEDLARTLGA